jgi:hypothetical protein
LRQIRKGASARLQASDHFTERYIYQTYAHSPLSNAANLQSRDKVGMSANRFVTEGCFVSRIGEKTLDSGMRDCPKRRRVLPDRHGVCETVPVNVCHFCGCGRLHPDGQVSQSAGSLVPDWCRMQEWEAGKRPLRLQMMDISQPAPQLRITTCAFVLTYLHELFCQ